MSTSNTNTNRVFGQSSKPKSFSVKKKLNNSLSNSSHSNHSTLNNFPKKSLSSSEKDILRVQGDEIDLKFGFDRIREGNPRLGWLLNYLPTTMYDETGEEKSGIDLYFIDREGNNFKASMFFDPYFYLDVSDISRIVEISQHLPKRLDGCRVELVDKEDLDMPNHLSGKIHPFLKLSFGKVSDLISAKSILRPIILQNQKEQTNSDYYDNISSNANAATTFTASSSTTTAAATSSNIFYKSEKTSIEYHSDPLSYVIDMREYDVPYAMRAAIDLDLRVGAWHIITPDSSSTSCKVEYQKDMLELCEPKILAFDIECEKSPLKFPSADRDRIFMISYMTPGQGYLLINREVVSQDVEDFEYTPLPKYPGLFTVINLRDEEAVLRKFISHIQELKPHVLVTYNGDFFDWPYIDARCARYSDLSLYKTLGIRCIKGEGNGSISTPQGGEYVGRCMVHLDAFSWVQRDSYLPQGNQGLKAVTKYKLGYDPIEVDPEDMLNFAREKPSYMASYSVSDAVATYYLYHVYVHNFIFSLSTIIPLGPEDVLRKGSGTLCEALLMVEAFKGNIICPNKQNDPMENFAPNGHLLESETYIGGHVECLEAGVFRSDIPVKFTLVSSALSHLIDRIDRDLAFACEVEHGIQRHEIVNYDEIRQAIVEKLEMLRDHPLREEAPVIYHLDVGAMYPNIILTNRLQPSAIVSHKDCAACDFNRAENQCKRNMTWTWRGEYNPASSAEYTSIRRQLSYEKLGEKTFAELSEKDQATLVKDRLKKYAHRVYKKTKVTSVEERVDTVCQRENAFYVNTVRAFRDRRYDYKILTKVWKGKKTDAEKKGDVVARKVAEDKEVLMDSLQLAHKCILNSFYGYVMRKGARWRSMEMAGIVTHTGAQLIMQARELVEQVGRPLELDTDGIWCVLPASFPQDFKIKTKNGKSISIGYPCAMLNADVHDRYTNHQYQELNEMNGKKGSYSNHSECSIFFELDGPYRAMVLPASPEEGKLLKKKYVVFNFDGTLAELKGFEVKRRGELELVKIFQSQVFEQFLSGSSLDDCYESVGSVANEWLDVLDNKGINMDDTELLELISEKKTISKTLDDYEGRKATSLTTAGRLADFLGAEMVKDKGLNCKLIISKYPVGAATTERAIPVAIFSADVTTRQYFLRKWLKAPTLDCEDFREVVDWEYYKQRLGKSIQKIITIPAGMQRVHNPVPRIEHPSWLQKRLSDQSAGLKQQSITSMFAKKILPAPVIFGRSDMNPTELIISGSPPGRGRGLISPLRPKIGSSPDPSSVTRKRLLFPDMEDIITPSSPALTTLSQYHEKSLNLGASPVGKITIAVDIMTKTPDPLSLSSEKTISSNLSPDSDLQTWLKARQSYWKNKRQIKKALTLKTTRWGQMEDYGGSFTSNNLTNTITIGGSKRPVAMTDFVRNTALQTTYGYWQIIEMQQMDSPGEFILWAMTSPTQLQRLKVIVPRIIYVNCSGQVAEKAAITLGGNKVIRDLPHARPCINLYEVRVPEAKYHRNEKSMAMFLCDPSVEGVYETQVPLLFRLIMELGCVAQVSRDTLQQMGQQHQQQRQYKLQDLSFVHTSTHSYLDRRSNGNSTSINTNNKKTETLYKQIFLYAVSDKSRNSGLGAVALFIVESTNEDNVSSSKPLSAKGYVWLSNGGTNSLENKPPFQRLYRRFQPDESTASVKFTSSYVSNMTEALRQCNERLTAYTRERQGPTIVIAQGNTDSRGWRRQLSSLQDFPLAVLAGNSLDEQFPAIGWQMFIAERLIQRYLIFPRWFDDRLHCARSSHIPVCNLGSDAITTMTDVTFARVLQHGRHLLWASENRIPDIGGLDSDHEVLVTGYKMEEISMNEPGAYRNVCIELDVYGLAICAIMNSGMLDTQSLTAAASTTGSSSGEVHCGKAFNLLKAVVAKWLDDFRIRSDPISDSLLTAFYRYLCGYGGALLFDPLLYRLVNDLMKKLFKRLIGEMKKLGTKIVFADFNRIVVHTNKRDIAAAKEYIDFILMAVHNTDTFSYLEITPKTFWEELLWLGPENFGGILRDDEKKEKEEEDIEDIINTDKIHRKDLEDDDDNDEDDDNDDEYRFLDRINREEERKRHRRYNDKEEQEQEQDDEDNDIYVHQNRVDDIRSNHSDDRNDENDDNEDSDIDVKKLDYSKRLQTKLQSNWAIAKFLPPAAQEYFHFIIGEYLLRHQAVKLDILHCSLSNQDDITNSCHTNLTISESELTSTIDKYMKDLLSDVLITKMLKITDDLGSIFHNANISDGSGVSCSRVALDFVKFTSYILALDTSYTDEVASLRRILLAQLRIREFSPLSKFINPCPSYILKDVICNYCSTCRDIDLLRDVSMNDYGEILSKDSSDGLWQCSHCHNDLDVQEIENRLLEELERLTVIYLSQDFRCPRTHLVSIRYCASHSDLAAPLEMDCSVESITQQLDVLKLVARANGFKWLKQTLDDLSVSQ